ncbi:hypothetical protein DL96DRAFT_1680711 [Flagelloscypha sp. PMI_526]|nr:hypothetical protein DL96DRAFT_1680711 [Flagelloscypha sp. PMI_526]
MSEDTHGLSVLSIVSKDGASMHQSGVMPPLLILQEIASRYEADKESLPGSFRVNKTFQLVGGVGDGGLLAFMLGHFGISINDTIREYRQILKAVHQHSDAASWSKDERSQKFEVALKALVASKTTPSDENYPLIKSKGENPRCKVFVTAMHALNLQHPVLLRTYRSRSDANPPPCTLVEAIRATTAMPDLFIPVPLGPPHRQINHVSPACHGFNNPIDQVRQEAKAAFPGRSISCIISLGCGHPGPVEIKDAKEDAARAVVQLAMDSVRAAEQTYRRLAGIPNLYFRFDVPYGLERAVLKMNPKLSEIRAHLKAYMGEEQTSDRIDSALKQLVERPPSIQASELDGILPVETTATVWVKKCPLPSPNFTGRRDDLNHMHAYFSSGVGSSSHIYVIYGLGGSGKTQLLLQFVLECQIRSPRIFDVVYFVDASLETTLETDLKAIAIDQKIGETAADAIQWLSCQTNRWLLVFDNADDKTFSIQKYIPKSIHGSVIITSRNPELAGLTAKDSGSRRIEDLEKWAAEALLKKLVGQRERPSDDEDSLVTQVVEWTKILHCFALAVTQAGSYMSATGRGYQEYIELFEVERSRLLRERKGHVPDNYPWSVYTTWAISFDQLKAAPRYFMQICSYLHYTGIPKDLLMRAVESQPLTEVDEGPQIWLSEFMNHVRNNDGRWDPISFDEIIQNVMSFSLIDYDPEQKLFSYHPLVHEWTREAIQSAYGQDFPDVQCALQLVALSAPKQAEKYSAAVLLKRRLLPHLDSLVTGAVHIGSVPMALRLSPVYEQSGRWNDYAIIFEHAREIGGSGGGWNSDICTNNLAFAYHALGRHSEALELQDSVLRSGKQARGDEHPQTLASMSNLATSYTHLGRYTEAVELQASVLTKRKQTLGDEHPATLTSMNNLAMSYIHLGRHAEALDLHLTVLANMKRTLGDEHPETLKCMNNVTISYTYLGKHAEALDLQLSILANRKRTLGDEHPDTLMTMNNLATSYGHLGRHADALDLELSVLATRKQTLGDEHPNTLTTMSNLAATYTHLGRHAEALDLQLSELETSKKILGNEHPSTLTSMNNLATTYQALGRHSEAVDLLTPAVSIATRVLGAEHSIASTLQRRLDYSISLNHWGPNHNSWGPNHNSWGPNHNSWGPNHNSWGSTHDSWVQDDNSSGDVLDGITATISQYEKERKWEEVIEQQEIAVEAFSAMLGEYHPKTVQLVYRLAFNLLRLGLTDDALPHIERAYRLVNDDSFPSESHLQQQVLKIKQLYARHCLPTNTESQTSLVESQVNLVSTEAQREIGVSSMPLAAGEQSPRKEAINATEAREAAFGTQSNVRIEANDTVASGFTRATEADISRTSAASPEINFATASRTSKAAADISEANSESLRNEKSRDISPAPNDRNERTALLVASAPVDDDPSVDQHNVAVYSSTIAAKRDNLVNEAHNRTTRKIDFHALDVSPPSDLVAASTSNTLLPDVAKAPAAHMKVPDLHNVPSENGAHERYMAKIELQKMKVQAKSGKQEQQYRLEMARPANLEVDILMKNKSQDVWRRSREDRVIPIHAMTDPTRVKFNSN